MEKMTFEQVWIKFCNHNRGEEVRQFGDASRLKAVVVFKQGPWFKQEFSEKSRSYIFSSDNKYFIDGMGGNSIYADCLDGSERGVRLDWYMNDWEVDYCYMVEE